MYNNIRCDECDDVIGFIYDDVYFIADTKICAVCKNKDGGIKK